MAKKRGNNEGSIHKRKSGSWRAQITLNGKRLSYTGKTKQDCMRWLRKMQDQIELGLTYENTQITFEEFSREWITSVEPRVRFSTVKQYNQILKQHILPRIGKMKLVHLKPIDIQKLYNEGQRYYPILANGDIDEWHAVLR